MDGFRLDAARHIIEVGNVQENTPATHEWWKDNYAYTKEISPESITVGEVWSSSKSVAKYLQGDEMDLAFDFELADNISDSALYNTAADEYLSLSLAQEYYPHGQYATFITNHFMDRLINRVRNHEASAKDAATLLLTSPGVPFIYYVEEIGMTGQRPDEYIRTPMQWTAISQAGFTVGEPWRPVNRDYPEKNVAVQSVDDVSLLSHYRQLIHLRNQHAALRIGKYLPVETNHKSVYAASRFTVDEVILIVVNLSSKEVSDYALSWDHSPLSNAYEVVLLMGEVTASGVARNEQGGIESYLPTTVLPPNTSLILQLNPAR